MSEQLIPILEDTLAKIKSVNVTPNPKFFATIGTLHCLLGVLSIPGNNAAQSFAAWMKTWVEDAEKTY